jgi:CubicO group peptidase (beta-lactamase class C family)
VASNFGLKPIRAVSWGGIHDIKKVSLGNSLLWAAEDPELPEADRDVLDGFVTSTMSAGGIPAMAFALTGPAGKYSAAFGTTAGRPLTLNDHFRIGSVSKILVAMAIWQQIDAGNLSLDDTVGQFVPGLPSGNVITIRHLLQMTSGLYNEQKNSQFMINVALNPSTAWSAERTLNLAKTNPLSHTPGTAYAYTNSQYIVLGFVLEAVTGKAIEDIVVNDVARRFGMTQTYWPTGSTIAPGSFPKPAAHGYGPNPLKSIPFIGWFVPATNDQTNINPEIFACAGALVSTLGDLQKLAAHVRDGTLLSPESQAMLLDSSTCVPVATGAPAPAPVNFGHGLGLINFGGEWWGHPGGINGYGTACYFHEPTGAIFVGMQNFSGLNIQSKVFAQAADHLYPGSMTEPAYTPL